MEVRCEERLFQQELGVNKDERRVHTYRRDVEKSGGACGVRSIISV